MLACAHEHCGKELYHKVRLVHEAQCIAAKQAIVSIQRHDDLVITHAHIPDCKGLVIKHAMVLALGHPGDLQHTNVFLPDKKSKRSKHRWTSSCSTAGHGVELRCVSTITRSADL